MNDKKQIEEIVRFIDTHIMAKKIAELIPSKIVSYDGRSKGQHLYIEQKMEIAKEMMKQGVVVWTMDEHANLVSQVRQEFEHEYKDKVVLSMEEIEIQQENYLNGIKYWQDMANKARKQASIEFSERVKSKIIELRRKYHEDYVNGLGDEEYNGLSGNNVDEILKEMGVE